jgi:ribonucleoside-diphosphate reductase alpha chain
LLSINLTKFIDNPFTPQASFNWDKFKQVVYIAQKLMDDVVDLEEEKINAILDKIENDPEPEEIKIIEKNLWIKIKEKLISGRRTGLSGIGLADTLASLNISYSSSVGISIAEEIYKQLAITAYKSSIDMANERGAFPVWNFNNEEFNPFLLRIHKELKEDVRYSHDVYGRRNIALLTIPPSGTISLLAKISSGIEPVYQLDYKRRRKVNPDHSNVSFIDKNGDSWEEYVVYHKGYEDWLKIYQGQVKEWCPYEGSTAYELNPLDRVKMQATIQKWVDHSISSTINLPETATETDVSNIYLEAWKQGLKGITVKI